MHQRLANPASNGRARLIKNNFSLYAVMDQMIWRPNPKGTQQLVPRVLDSAANL